MTKELNKSKGKKKEKISIDAKIVVKMAKNLR